MPTKICLSADEKLAILTDFVEWSGGSQPSECDTFELQSYLDHAVESGNGHDTATIWDFINLVAEEQHLGIFNLAKIN